MQAQNIDKILEYRIEDGCAVITFNMQDYPTNVINQASMEAFNQALGRAYADEQVKGIILTAARKEFVVGADLNMLLSLEGAEAIFQLTQNLNALLRRYETGGKPVVAALNGSALGGGYEIALAAHYRIAVNDRKIQIGLPEVQLGVLPGGGGTQRLPRMVGLEKGLEYILQAKRFNPEKALSKGLIDELVDSPDALLAAAKRYIQEDGNAVQPWDEKKFKLPGGGIMTPNGAQTMSAAIALLRKKTYGNYPGAEYALSAVYEGLLLPFDRALVTEARYFTKAVQSPEARNMIRTLFFHLNEANKGEARPADLPHQQITKVGMLGAGMMGAGIAYVSSKAGMEVALKDVSRESARKGKAYAEKQVQKQVERGKMPPEAGEALLNRIHPTAAAEDLKGADLVIEAVFEDRKLKAEVTREAEAEMNPEGVFASNTSTLPITSLAEASARPAHFIGLHFFSPVEKMPLVEIIMGEKTSDTALAMAIDYVRAIKKTPIVVQDGRGFYTSRVFATYVKEGMELLQEGCPPAMIENAGKQAGMPVGPLALADEVSISLLYHIVKQTEADTGQTLNDAASQVGRLFVEHLERPGKKAGKGFYEYPEDAKKYLWPGLGEHFPVAREHSAFETMQKRLMHIQAVEAARCLEEGIVRSAKDANIGSILGWGFAPFTGGVLSYVDYVGVRQFVEECDSFSRAAGERYHVPELLRKMAAENATFF